MIAVISIALGNQCPDDPDSIHGCTCDSKKIFCDFGDQEADLDGYFRIIAHGHSTGQQKWQSFELNSNVMEKLPPNLFHGVHFREIHLNFCPKLSCIHPDAFYGMEQFMVGFYSRHSNLSEYNANGACNLFGSLSKIKTLVEVNITSSQIVEIPGFAFDGYDGTHDFLTNLDFNGRAGASITAIGYQAFFDLTAIENLDFSEQKITTINSLAFQFDTTSNVTITINLEQNTGLTGDTFFSSAFDSTSRPINLKLGHNKDLNFLKQDVFYTFLAGNGTIDIIGSPMGYCEENQWLFDCRDQLNLTEKLLNPLSQEGMYLFNDSKGTFLHKCSKYQASLVNGSTFT